MLNIPASTQILVIGGGPGGSTAATLLARQGFSVTLLEKAQFPRYHIGESLLPSILQIMDLLGAREKMESYGFQRKEGAFLDWGADRWPLNFGELSGNNTYAFQVVRSEFDKMLIDHAREQGVDVYEGVEVRSLTFEGERPCKAMWQVVASSNGDVGRQGEICFDYLIDASGRSSVMTTRYLQNRRYHQIFQNIAIWGYWENADRMVTGRVGDICVNAVDTGWLWAIPLSDGTMSVGVVMHKDALNARKPLIMEDVYRESIEGAEFIKKIVADATLTSELYTETDYSYTSDRFSGPGYFLVGDAACFLDPLLSSGVHLATFSAMLAAASIGSVQRGEVTETEVISFFENSYRQAYLRFLVFLSAFYDVGRKKENYFWEAQRLTQEDVESPNLKAAFLKLVTGLKDLKDATSTDTHHFILNEMTQRIDENLRMRKDKETLASLQGAGREKADANASFFNSVEGFFSLNESDAVDGLFIVTQPQLGLGRVRSSE